jgi:hypothetical protein
MTGAAKRIRDQISNAAVEPTASHDRLKSHPRAPLYPPATSILGREASLRKPSSLEEHEVGVLADILLALDRTNECVRYLFLPFGAPLVEVAGRDEDIGYPAQHEL